MNTLIFKIAWRNIWRNSRRTAITLAAMVIGVGIMIWMITFFDGFHIHFIEAQLKYGLGAAQVHAAGYQDDKEIEQVIRDPEAVLAVVRDLPEVTGVSVRLNTFGLVSHGSSSLTSMVLGVDPVNEPGISIFPEKITDGEWLPESVGDTDRLPVVIGSGIAKKLDVGLGDRLFFMVQGLTGDIGYAVFFVHGIFTCGISEMDKSMVYVPIGSLQEIMAVDVEEFQNAVHEITMQVKPGTDLYELVATIESQLGNDGEDLEVLNWRQMQPGLVQVIEMDDYFLYTMMVFVFIIVAAGIMNTFLMAVFERIREFGILTSLGSRPSSIFQMVMIESTIIGLIGALLGLLAGLLGFCLNTIYPWDFSNYTEMSELTDFDFSEKIYPALIWGNVLRASVGIFIVTILAAVYPAAKAALLKPIEALRHV